MTGTHHQGTCMNIQLLGCIELHTDRGERVSASPAVGALLAALAWSPDTLVADQDIVDRLWENRLRAPVLAVGDGALGFWKGLAEVFPETREQRCWVHKTANVLDAMPKSAQQGAKKAIQDIYNAEDHDRAEAAITTFAQLYGAKFPKAVKKITDDQDELLAFFDFPAEHWIHLRTTNPIESTFSSVRPRTKVTRGAGSRTAALSMVFKLVESAQQRWRAVKAPHLVALVRAGARFERGQLVERPAAVAA
ncbi:transposase [Streptomyces sp. 2231.1]|uniref:transposase n=1 Tax=Streptomyces sp. 2231.1 TaxID=1855347 RepID=UPI003526754F